MPSPHLPLLATFHHPAVSLLQSAMHEVLARTSPEASGQASAAIPTAALAEHPHMQELALAAEHVLAVRSAEVEATAESPTQEWARLLAEYAIAAMHGDKARMAELMDELQGLTPYDPRWIECAEVYLARLLERREMEYVAWRSLDDSVLTTLPDAATVAVIGDWGTGTGAAKALLAQVAAFDPDVVIHLGDVYYAGTGPEYQANFLGVFESVFPGYPKRPVVMSSPATTTATAAARRTTTRSASSSRSRRASSACATPGGSSWAWTPASTTPTPSRPRSTAR